MRLAAFIRENTKQIITEWENFARTLIPDEGMGPLSLRDHIEEILAFIVDDIQSAQTPAEQIKKSRSKNPKNNESSAAETHASLRQAGGFNLDQMVSEYRALRASIIKLWDAQTTEASNMHIKDLIRFNESIDQALTESISHYTVKLDHSRDLFLGVLSHDLGNPLGAIDMSAQLISKAASLSELQTMLLTQITDSTARATEIVTHLLDLTRARLGSGLPIIKADMDMGFVSNQIVHEMRAMHPDRVIKLDVTGETDGLWDKPRMGQVFSNLLGNAMQYGFSDSPISVKVEGSEDKVFISIHNEGIPIPPNAIGHIFDSSNRGEQQEGDKLGTGNMHLGLGLYITKEIISAHEGSIKVTSTERTGTTFTIHLPRTSQGIKENHNAQS